ncbi:hypothetical protein GFS24_01245 [Chitinophaga sp. SYP-B3965]|uniref:hypothetical protein n=1 Tax=Chitinophaga sp. SYP-B3965 TaxID=2663120 RepID=UPI0012995908|nr:hypothetical protein [Chitinophaga sp. SYP-B3965]MRG43714.1 hypothetical protein [Chitinophaga sp. SYP-B3965]
MAIFDFPRFNVKGLIQVNVGTANNDDYSGYQFPKGNFYPGQPVRLADSKNVQPVTYGMTDDQWVKWVQSSIPVYAPPTKVAKFFSRYEGEPTNKNVIPGEWNYYGDMGLTMINVKLVGMNDPYQNVKPDLAALMRASTLSFNNRPGSNGRSTAMLIDINPEDPTNSQVFTDNLAMMTDTQVVFNGKPTKAMTRWINFQRNANLTGPNGAAASFQCVVPLSELQGQAILQGLPLKSPSTGKALAGIVCRYTLYRPLQVINYFKYTAAAWIQQMITLYSTGGTNADFLELQGTIAPWYEGDAISQTTGRLLNPLAFPAPPDFKGNGKPGAPMRVAPVIANLDLTRKVLSIDCSPTFPDNYKGTDGPNKYDPMITGNDPKYDIGNLTLSIKPKDGHPAIVQIGTIDYKDMLKNDANGWIFDFPINAALLNMVAEGQLFVNCQGTSVKQNILEETPYLIFSERSGAYGEQNPVPGSTSANFRDDSAVTTSVSFIAYRNGKQVPSGDPQKFSLYYYDTTPNQAPGPRTLLQANYVLGNPVAVPVSSSGNILITCTPAEVMPPLEYGNFDPLTGSILNLRILPNDINYSQYYKDPKAKIPEGNDSLTFQVIYDQVLRNYYLLYPAMSKVVKLNDPLMWEDATMARELMNRISLPAWPTSIAMPRTRDLSDSRRQLLTAWCLKIINRKPSSAKIAHP